MSDWKPKRFWQTAAAVPVPGGFAIALDARRVQTPAKAPLIVPTRALADAIAAEWDKQTDKIDPRTMPATRAANAAIDKVGPQRADVIRNIADYGDSDLLCYRATEPAALVARQSAAWDPLLQWAAETLGAPLTARPGVMHLPQAPAALAALTAEVGARDDFGLAALSELVSISGSLVLGLAVARGHLDADHAFDLSRIDEVWQIEQWGADDEAKTVEALKRTAFCAASDFHANSLLREQSVDSTEK
jgi:chaperone required for assembly of F1-ATPase